MAQENGGGNYYYMEPGGGDSRIIRSIEQEPVRPEILPELPERANVLPTQKRCGTKDRDNALDFVTEMHAEGYISSEELEVRRAHIMESATHKMLTRITGDFPESIDQWLIKQAREEQKRQEAAKPKPALPDPEDKPVPLHSWLTMVFGVLAATGGVLSIFLRSPAAMSAGFIVAGIALIILGILGGIAVDKG